jgi:hypothetical protein
VKVRLEHIFSGRHAVALWLLDRRGRDALCSCARADDTIKQNVAFSMLARPSPLSLRRAQLTQPREKASRCETGERRPLRSEESLVCTYRTLFALSTNLARASAPMTAESAGTVLTLLKVQLTGRFVAARVGPTPLLRIGQLAEHVARGGSVESGAALIHLDGKICSAKSNCSRHRDRKKGISDFVQKFVSHRHILPFARPNFSVISLGVISSRMRCCGNHPARHQATFRGGVVILLWDEPRLIRPPR